MKCYINPNETHRDMWGTLMDYYEYPADAVAAGHPIPEGFIEVPQRPGPFYRWENNTWVDHTPADYPTA